MKLGRYVGKLVRLKNNKEYEEEKKLRHSDVKTFLKFMKFEHNQSD